MSRLLVIDDHDDSANELVAVGESLGFEVALADTLTTARELLGSTQPDVALLNLHVGPGDSDREGFKLLENSDLARVADVLLVTESPNYHSAARGMRLGATDYFNYPAETDRIRDSLVELGQTRQRETGADDEAPTYGLIGQSPAMERVCKLICKVAATDITVFLAGESGSGKEVVATAIHDLSPRKGQPFVAVNCGAVASELMESELFGHERGAFTGAAAQHKGYFERAAGGTLFLDEVTETSAELQVKLLRVLEVGRYRRVGGEKDLATDVRIIASTNRDPEAAVSEGILREDLYYRLAQFPMRLPALRERGDDVLLLADHFLQLLNDKYGEKKCFSAEVRDLLRIHDWPGNVRELKNAVARAHVLAGSELEAEDLPGNIPATAVPRGDSLRLTIGHTLADVERRMILATLSHFDGDKKQAAETLGISLKTLYNRLKSYKAPDTSES